MSDDYLTVALEADLKSEYGVDIGQYWRREIPLRKFLKYVAMLPDNSRTVTAISGQPDGLSNTDVLIAMAINEQRQWFYSWICSKLDKGKGKPSEPDMIELPDPAPVSQSTRDAIDAGRYYAEQRKFKDEDFASISDVQRLLSGGF